MDRRAQAFLAALARGEVCLGPTDTLPGLTFDPRQDRASAQLIALKGRPPAQGFIGLVADFEGALAFWNDVGATWRRALARLWPAPLSVIFTASPQCPQLLLAQDGTMALRVPRLATSEEWLRTVMRQLGAPLPSTSVNYHGEPAANQWTAAVQWARTQGVTIPVSECAAVDAVSSMPSTLLRITGPTTFQLVRRGAVPQSTIEASLL